MDNCTENQTPTLKNLFSVFTKLGFTHQDHSQKNINPFSGRSFLIGDLGIKYTSILFTLILFFSFFIRSDTFRLPHYSGDQTHYIALAFKLDQSGIEGFNLRNIDLYNTERFPHLIELAASKGKGSILNSLEAQGLKFYDRPLHHTPYGFPLAIMISHKMFANTDLYQLIWVPKMPLILDAKGAGIRPEDFQIPKALLGKQFYYVIVPLFFSLLLIISTFFISLTAFNNRISALIAMFLVAVSPINILSSQRIWADDMTSALTALGILSYLNAVKNKKAFLFFSAGLFFGLSTITKQSGLLIIPVVFCWHLFCHRDLLSEKGTFFKIIFDKDMLLLLSGLVLITGHWFYTVYNTYGNPLLSSPASGPVASAAADFYATVRSRPLFTYLVGIPYQNPLFIASIFSVPLLWLDKTRQKDILLFILWFVVFFLAFILIPFFSPLIGMEHRYMLPSYPALAVLSGYSLNKIRVFIDQKTKVLAGTFLVVLALGLSAMWSVPMGTEAVLTKKSVLLRPF